MKFLIAILMVMVLLTGCGVEEPGASEALTISKESMDPQDTTEALGENVQPSEGLNEPSSYIPGSPMELWTKGAVLSYDPGISQCTALFPMGENLLLVSGYQAAALTVLEGENLVVGAQKYLGSPLQVSTGTVQVNDRGVAYYSETSREVVFLNANLQEFQRIQMPDEMIGTPAIAPDWNSVYYCTLDAVKVMDIQTGISRMLKEQPAASQSIREIHFDGSVLECYTENNESEPETIYLSTQTGQTLHSGRELEGLGTFENRYLTAVKDASVRLFLAGELKNQPKQLQLAQDAILWPALSLNAVVVVEGFEEQRQLRWMDLTTGTFVGELQLNKNQEISYLTATNDRIWLIVSDLNENRELLYSWSAHMRPVGDVNDRVVPMFTKDAPDTEGLVRCKAKADALGKKYGVEIRVWEDALTYQPDGYIVETEYHVAAYERDLAVLESVFTKFPEGFFQDVAEGTSNRELIISLVRSLSGDPTTGILSQENGAQYWVDGSACIALALGDKLEQSFYHELSHVIDNRVISTTYAYDFWDDFNPSDFRYDYDYIANISRADDQFLGESGDRERAFIDMYSMSFPKEDRARIFEYAMLESSEGYFASGIMQNKLRAICLGIREAMKLEGETPYPWEQYLISLDTAE